jgi:hypothetical protein
MQTQFIIKHKGQLSNKKEPLNDFLHCALLFADKRRELINDKYFYLSWIILQFRAFRFSSFPCWAIAAGYCI